MGGGSGSHRAAPAAEPVTDELWRDWHDAVNMTGKELEQWLRTDESQAAGEHGTTGKHRASGRHRASGHEDTGESTGHQSGREIVRLLGKRRDELTDEDVAHMRKVIGYVRRHLAQRPAGDVTDSRWRHSLMNWGHDPLK